MRRQREPGHRTVDPGLPGAVVSRLAVYVLDRVLAEVPDVSVRILGVIIVGHFDRLAVLGDGVVNDPDLDPVAHHLGLLGDLDHVVLLRAGGIVGDSVYPAAADRHRPAVVVDLGAEVSRVEIDRIVSLRKLRPHARCAGRPLHAETQDHCCGEGAHHDGGPPRAQESVGHVFRPFAWLAQPVITDRDERPVKGLRGKRTQPGRSDLHRTFIHPAYGSATTAIRGAEHEGEKDSDPAVGARASRGHGRDCSRGRRRGPGGRGTRAAGSPDDQVGSWPRMAADPASDRLRSAGEQPVVSHSSLGADGAIAASTTTVASAT